ncbi:hypothetical protein [Halocatena salina]|uniref:Uncharacterized protein n=1 Tax=Halocatena salina TaxID=2934340 RepID=A0A8U0A620_9EURY|nr:hypothetical protein [Halocatena salina]UPM44615.1 hypothetical protein MW046_16335 [Halocatena salina]
MTFIEREKPSKATSARQVLKLIPGEHRRNIITHDTALNHLVEKRFRSGDIICPDDRLCEPCGYL